MGTLAVFTKTVEPIEGSISASKFIIDTSTQTKNPSAALIPGEDGFWDFSVVNFTGNTVNEVNMDMRIRIDLTNYENFNPIEGLKVGLFSGDRLIGKSIIKRGYIVLDFENAFNANVKKTYDFKIRFFWDKDLAGEEINEENLTNANQSRVIVSVTGTQCMHSNPVYGETIVEYYSELIEGVKVSKITVTAEGGITVLPKKKTTLQMYAMAEPSTAPKKRVIWSLSSTTHCVIDPKTGLLRKTNNGKTCVTIYATATDGSGAVGSYVLNFE